MDSFKILVNGFLLEKAGPGLILIGVLCFLIIVIAVVLSNNSIKKGAEDVKHSSLDNGKMLNSDSID